MSQKNLIQQDQRYIKLKHRIMHNMNNAGKTPWWDDQQWQEMSGLSQNEFRRFRNEMLDDPEINCEYNREVFPNLSRWVMRK